MEGPCDSSFRAANHGYLSLLTFAVNLSVQVESIQNALRRLPKGIICKSCQLHGMFTKTDQKTRVAASIWSAFFAASGS